MAYPYSSNFNNFNNFSSNYPNGNVMYNTQQPLQAPQYQAQQQIYLPITYINGYNEAKRFLVFPNQTIFLKDDENGILYEKQVDSAGKVYLRPYKLTQIKLDDLESGKALNSDNQYASKGDLTRLESVVLNNINNLKSVIETTLLNNNTATPCFESPTNITTDSSTDIKTKKVDEKK